MNRLVIKLWILVSHFHPGLAKAHQSARNVDAEKLLVAQVPIEAGTFRFGANVPADSRESAGSGVAKRAKVRDFAIDATAVNNDQFRRFVRDTKYVTEAETFQWSFVHELLLTPEIIKKADAEGGIGRVKDASHWVGVEGAFWRRPEGPGSAIKDRGDHPAVHISYVDAQAYCKWANGRRLPTEKEWEYAARGGLSDEPFPWGEDKDDGQVNGWQGDFPKTNTKEDGWVGTAPVSQYSSPNAYELHNMVGNVWEWCEGGDEKARPLRGGSYVDSLDGTYNHHLRVWTRMKNSPDSGSCNTGFRCASGKGKNLEEPNEPAGPPKPRQKASDLDQEKMQEVLAERGQEGLQEWLAENGVGGSVMTPAQLQKKRDELQRMKAEMQAEL